MKDKTVGFGFVGRWNDGDIGWCLPGHISRQAVRGRAEGPSGLFEANAQPTDRAVLCKITVEVVKDSLGREITRKPRRAR